MRFAAAEPPFSGTASGGNDIYNYNTTDAARLLSAPAFFAAVRIS